MQILFPSNTRELIEGMIDADGRDVLFYTHTLEACTASGCSLDPVTNTSTNSLCLTCSGNYWIPVWSSNSIKAHVSWKFADDLDWHTGGYVFKGDGIVKIMYSGPYMDILDNTEYMVVDGKRVSVENITLLGIPQVNRVIIDFREEEKLDE